MPDLRTHPAADVLHLVASRPVRRLPRAAVVSIALTMATVTGFGAGALDAGSVAAVRAPKMIVHPVGAHPKMLTPEGTSWA